MTRTPDAPVPDATSGALRALTAVVAVEAAVFFGAGGLVLGEVVLGRGSQSVVSSLLLAMLAAAAGAALLVVARGLLGRRRWSLAPALFAQLLALPIGWALVGTQAVVGALVMAVAAGALVLLLAPSGGGRLVR